MDRRALVTLLLLALAPFAAAEEDPYVVYVRTAPEFQPVAHVEPRGWDTWIYMPWPYRWTIGFDDAAGEFCREHGIHGGVADHGKGPFDWFARFGLRFYGDHVAGKGILFLRGAKEKGNFRPLQTDPFAIRAPPLDDRTLREAGRIARRNIRRMRDHPGRLAYALDDEISWGAFVLPLPWSLHDDDKAYAAWLARYHGEPRATRYVTPEYTRSQLDRRLGALDFSPLLDRMTYNDSWWAIFLGELVETANTVDPVTPCGFVGGQGPSLWGGYDYAKLAKKVQFLEVYDVGSAPAIARSLTRGRVPMVSTHFHADGEDHADAWKAWYTFAQGQKGLIGWVEGWFEDGRPRPWLTKLAPTLKELAAVQGPKLAGATRRHDGIALYYSHASLQVSWILDAEPHGKTWPNRGKDHLLGTAHNVRRAWERILADAGLAADFLGYDEVVARGVPSEYGVLILPACFALSDAEARRIEAFVEGGGRVVADFMCGLFDQYGRGRDAGALDGLFGVEHDGTETRRDFFGRRLWVETDQEEGFYARRWSALFATHGGELRGGFAVPERRLAGPYAVARGEGRAIYLNLSPQRYLARREAGEADAEARRPFVEALAVVPEATVAGAPDLEITRWGKGGRTYLFVVTCPTQTPEGERVVPQGTATITLRFARDVEDLVDERTGERHGAGSVFRLPFRRHEAALVSYR